MKRFLVTGGAGFIGTNFIQHILSTHTDIIIVNVDKLTYAANPENAHIFENDSRYRFVQGDICDAELVDTLVKDADVVVHFAAESHVDRSIEDAGDFVRTNLLGTQVLLDAAIRYGTRFHHISTDEVFGSLGAEGYFTESTPYDPRSPYSASKAGSDHLVRAAFHTHGLPVTISNCSNNYGPYQHPEKLIPLFITNLMKGRKVPVYGNGLNVRDWLYVEDHVRAIDLIIREGRIGETYCIGGGEELTNLDVTRRLLTGFDVGEEMICYVEDRKGHDFRYSIDSSKIHKELGWKPSHGFNEALAKTIDWYKENKEWWMPLKNS